MEQHAIRSARHTLLGTSVTYRDFLLQSIERFNRMSGFRVIWRIT